MFYKTRKWTGLKKEFFEKDGEALASDWEAVGDDLKSVLFGDFDNESENTSSREPVKCRSCNHPIEAEFVDIGVGMQQVSDWQCSNDQCPEYLAWLKSNHDIEEE